METLCPFFPAPAKKGTLVSTLSSVACHHLPEQDMRRVYRLYAEQRGEPATCERCCCLLLKGRSVPGQGRC